MAYTTEDIRNRASQLMGVSLDTAQAAAMGAICAAAAGELERRLRDGVSAGELGETFVTAAGLLAISMYIEVYGAGEDFSSFRAGNISVSKKAGGSAESADSLRKKAEALLGEYLTDGGFAFMGVRG